MNKEVASQTKSFARRFLLLFVSLVLTFSLVPLSSIVAYADILSGSKLESAINPFDIDEPESAGTESDYLGFTGPDEFLDSEQGEVLGSVSEDAELIILEEQDNDGPSPQAVAITPFAIDAPTVSTNSWSNAYYVQASPNNSYLYVLSNGNYERVEWIDDKLIVEQYTQDFAFVSGMEIPEDTYKPSDLALGQSVVWGGFFVGASHNYVATGQLNSHL